jgi:hypothetical protein
MRSPRFDAQEGVAFRTIAPHADYEEVCAGASSGLTPYATSCARIGDPEHGIIMGRSGAVTSVSRRGLLVKPLVLG